MMDQEIEALLRPTTEQMGFRLVRAKLMEIEGRRTLQVMIERLDGTPLIVDDCANVSHAASALLDVHEPISGAYHLEVTSPGIDRPLITPEDFIRFIGYEAKAQANLPIDGRRRWRGIIEAVEDGQLRLRNGGELFSVPLSKIADAKLVMNDALLEAHRKGLITH